LYAFDLFKISYEKTQLDELNLRMNEYIQLNEMQLYLMNTIMELEENEQKVFLMMKMKMTKKQTILQRSPLKNEFKRLNK
jgi:hypothetical protein